MRKLISEQMRVGHVHTVAFVYKKKFSQGHLKRTFSVNGFRCFIESFRKTLPRVLWLVLYPVSGIEIAPPHRDKLISMGQFRNSPKSNNTIAGKAFCSASVSDALLVFMSRVNDEAASLGSPTSITGVFSTPVNRGLPLCRL